MALNHQKTDSHIKAKLAAKMAYSGDCWIWMGAKAQGYGRISVNGKGKNVHRVAYEIFRGPIPERLLVCHTCDNRACFNPRHLWIGDCRDNAFDAIAKGRLKIKRNPDSIMRGLRSNGRYAGEAHFHKLLEKDVIKIRESYIPFVRTIRMLADEYQVTYGTIRKIVRGENWKFILNRTP